MHIDSFWHGRMVIDGREENRDLIIAGGRIHPNWWRDDGHVLSADDLQAVWEEKPELLIVGTGSTGRMRPDRDLPAEAERRGIELEVLPTAEAVGKFNDLSANKEANVAAAFHLTCSWRKPSSSTHQSRSARNRSEPRKSNCQQLDTTRL